MHDEPASDIQKRIAALQDQAYLKMLEQGGVIVAIKDENGNVVRTELVDFPAAMHNAINGWRKLNRIQTPNAGSGGGSILDEADRRLADGRIKFNGQPIQPPELDVDGEDAALG